MKTTTRRTSRKIFSSIAGAALLAGSAVLAAQPAQAATWNLYQKHDCIEVLTDGVRYVAENVCADKPGVGGKPGVAQYVSYSHSGATFEDQVNVCLPHGTQVSLGIREEFHSVSASGGDGCDPGFNGGKPYQF